MMSCNTIEVAEIHNNNNKNSLYFWDSDALINTYQNLKKLFFRNKSLGSMSIPNSIKYVLNRLAINRIYM